MPVSPLRSGLLGNVIEIAARKSSVQIAETLIPNCPVGIEEEDDELLVVVVGLTVVEVLVDDVVDEEVKLVVVCPGELVVVG